MDGGHRPKAYSYNEEAYEVADNKRKSRPLRLQSPLNGKEESSKKGDAKDNSEKC